MCFGILINKRRWCADRILAKLILERNVLRDVLALAKRISVAGSTKVDRTNLLQTDPDYFETHNVSVKLLTVGDWESYSSPS
ncbi:hypothetical protein HGRIS_012238 [Hohenbuehelia grisea]|uniref:Uncharacterized protein n=1 Tax=Hohenbuehelia grisea TaxID=104357 RepID=A0ABR3IRQ3_9AGAR